MGVLIHHTRALLVIALIIATAGLLAPPASAADNTGHGEMRYKYCTSSFHHQPLWSGGKIVGFQGVTERRVADADCTGRYVGLVWYTGSYYAACSRQRTGDVEVALSTRATDCASQGRMQRFVKSQHKVRGRDRTWSPKCTIFKGDYKVCRF